MLNIRIKGYKLIQKCKKGIFEIVRKREKMEFTILYLNFVTY